MASRVTSQSRACITMPPMSSCSTATYPASERCTCCRRLVRRRLRLVVRGEHPADALTQLERTHATGVCAHLSRLAVAGRSHHHHADQSREAGVEALARNASARRAARVTSHSSAIGLAVNAAARPLRPPARGRT